MNELDRYLFEVARVQKNTHLYEELFCTTESVEVLNNLSSSVFGVFQQSLNSDVILSVARLFDSDAYKNNSVNIEYLSQRNLAKKYKKYITDDAKKHQEQTIVLWDKFNIKNYRDIVLAHNTKSTMLGDIDKPKHGIEIKEILMLLNSSFDFIFTIRVCLAIENNETGLPIMPNTYRGGLGQNFIRDISKNITRRSSGTRHKTPRPLT